MECLREGIFEQARQPGLVRLVCAEDHIAALNIGAHVLEAQPLETGCQVRHLDQVFVADINAAQYSHVPVHHLLYKAKTKMCSAARKFHHFQSFQLNWFQAGVFKQPQTTAAAPA